MNRALNTTKRILARLGPNVLAPIIAGAVAIAVSSIALLLSGYSPTEAFSAMWKVLDSTESVIGIINKAAWFYVAGVAVAIGFKMGLFNIGADGQYRLAALFAAYFGAKADLPAVLHVLYIMLIAVIVGAAWAAIPGILKITRGVNEVISTIMLNFVATGLTAWLLNTYFRNRTGGLTAETKVIPGSGRIPSLNALFEAIGFHFGGVVLQGYVVLAILVGIGYYVLLFRSRYGFELRVTGVNPSAAKASGVNPKRMILITIMLSGAVAGLIGMGPLLSDPQYYRYGDQFPLTLGFTGLSLALLGRNNPVGIALAAIVWAAIERGTQPLSIIGIPQEIGIILQGSFLLSAVIVFEVFSRRAQEQAIRDAAAKAAPRRWERRREPRGRGHRYHRRLHPTRRAASVVRGSQPRGAARRPRVGGDVDRPGDRRRRPADVVGHHRARLAAGDPDRPRRHRRPVRRTIRDRQHRPRGHDGHGHDHGRLLRVAVRTRRRPRRRSLRRHPGGTAARAGDRHVRRQPHRGRVRDQHHRPGCRPVPGKSVVHHP